MDQSVIILIVIAIIAFLLIHFVFSKCPKCKKSGTMVEVGRKELKRDEIVDLDNIGKNKGYKVTYEVTTKCKNCGYTQTHRIFKNEGKVK